ncbi:MAG: FAD-binding oxidoreductase [Betaproteobacteria bacterium]|nr:FAD-binding oxidoreductase [Betaproteobacteria bacterium]
MTEPAPAYAAKRDALAARFKNGSGPVGLAKDTSNLFRDRSAAARRQLDVRPFCEVLRVDREAGILEAEGMVPYEALVQACLAHDMMPAVVPQLKTITLGGAVAGVGIEASSHRYGLVHETVPELDVIGADGRVLTCTPENEYADLFFGFPNSYGTLGYALRVKARAMPVKPYVRLEHLPFGDDATAFFAEIERRCRSGDADFIDGTLFGPDRLFLTLGRFVDEAPYTSDYTFEHIYYRSIAGKREDWLTVRDFIWRWDTDWFWCSKNVFAQNPLIRRLYGRKRLGSRTYTRIMRWNSRVGLTGALERILGLRSESVIQDVDVPLARAAEFLDFYSREIGIWPAWICPIGPQGDAARYVLYPLRNEWYVNFGFWDVIRTRKGHPPGHFNRLIERKVAALGGIKSLYSDSFFPEAEFWSLYGGEAYRRLKSKYDPDGVFPDLYAKCVLRH